MAHFREKLNEDRLKVNEDLISKEKSFFPFMQLVATLMKKKKMLTSLQVRETNVLKKLQPDTFRIMNGVKKDIPSGLMVLFHWQKERSCTADEVFPLQIKSGCTDCVAAF